MSREVHVRFCEGLRGKFPRPTYCIILVGSSKAADRVMENVSKFIEKKLGLKVNMTKSKVSKPNDIKYLGFTFYKDPYGKQWKAKPHQISVEKLKAKLKVTAK